MKKTFYQLTDEEKKLFDKKALLLEIETILKNKVISEKNGSKNDSLNNAGPVIEKLLDIEKNGAAQAGTSKEKVPVLPKTETAQKNEVVSQNNKADDDVKRSSEEMEKSSDKTFAEEFKEFRFAMIFYVVVPVLHFIFKYKINAASGILKLIGGLLKILWIPCAFFAVVMFVVAAINLKKAVDEADRNFVPNKNDTVGPKESLQIFSAFSLVGILTAAAHFYLKSHIAEDSGRIFVIANGILNVIWIPVLIFGMIAFAALCSTVNDVINPKKTNKK